MDDNVYAAEKIIAKRKIKGVTEYRISWKGYPPSANTWEPYDNILDKALIHEFENKKQALKSKKLAMENKRRASKTNKPSKRAVQAIVCDEKPIIIEQPIQSGDEFASPAPPSLSNQQTSPLLPLPQSLPTPTPPPPPSPLSLQTPAPQPTPPPPPTPTLRPTPTPPPPPPPPLPAQQQHQQQQHKQQQQQKQQQQPSSNPAQQQQHQKQQPSLATLQLQHNAVNNTSNVSKAHRGASKFAIMNTIVTDVTVNDQTITISESKSPQCFFKDVERSSIAVDATHSTANL